MIWAEHRSEAEPLTAHIKSEISRACLWAGCHVDPDAQLELARSVTFYAGRQYSGSAVPSGYLLLLAARALWAVGEPGAARRLIAAKSEELNLPEPCAAAAFQSDLSLQVWWELLSLQALRPSARFESVSGSAWTLDLSRTFLGDRDCLELMAFRVMNAVVQAIAPLWDSSSGAGALALLRVRAVAASLLKRPKRDRKTDSLSSELMKQCERRLSALSRERGWSKAPAVLSLDW